MSYLQESESVFETEAELNALQQLLDSSFENVKE